MALCCAMCSTALSPVNVHGLFEAVDAVHLGDDLVWGGLAPVGDVGDLDVPVAGRVVVEHDPHLVDKVGQDVGVGHLQHRFYF